ncbi:hypothetical protein FA95DRAFT_396664 [Auriscalpium vulgare]|uniref:Uncharacterized protein n=1 Tax=Auriscalpium vulgare TaxID=40419 RepID=A0ACB8S4Q5_9AGAM|nr:hypothetical protein FA95DRAFT_396664 [Auriscalpium vulgare]
MVLAQRLNELASANAEGLLDDNEYRALRQNLFDRLASASVPQEAPLVPNAGPTRSQARDHSTGRPSSTINRDSLHAPSVRSRASVSSSMSGLFRRATGRKSSSTSHETDSTSLFSVGSSSSAARRFFARTLSKQASESSLRSDATHTPHDTIFSATHRYHPGSHPQGSSQTTTPSVSRSTSRSTKRPPPSAFHARSINGSSDSRGPADEILDDDALTSAKDIRRQIEAIETEARRLMDAFNGLELSTLTKQSRVAGGRPSPSLLLTSSASIPHFDRDEPYEPHLRAVKSFDTDGVSVRSMTSVGTSLSAARSPTRQRPIHPGSPLVSQPVSLGRKSSFGSVSSRGRERAGGGSGSTAPVLPTLGRLGVGSTSSLHLNLTSRSQNHLPLAPVAEGDSRESVDAHHLRINTQGLSPRADDVEIIALEGEMADIRRRRTEVMARYEERVEYLRAKLKGAELHEKLLRK